MKISVSLLKKISETPGVSGFEKEIRNLIIKEIKKYVDEITIDNMGNIVAYRKGLSAKRLMLAAHMDEIGFIVKHIDDQGFIRFLPIGGFDPKTLTAQRVVIHGKKNIIGVMGSKPIHIMKSEEKNKAVEIESFFIDTGMSKDEVEKYIFVGDPITRERELIEMGDCVNGKSLDNRVSVYVLIECLKNLYKKELPYDVYAVFTVQEEVGLRGAQVASQEINPDFGIVIDTTIAYDVPGAAPHENISKLGEGVAIKIMDGSVISDLRMVDFMKKNAKKYKIKWQSELLPAGGTDTAYVQRMNKSGSIAGAISIPTRHIHQVIESCHKDDIEAAIELLTNCILNIDDYNWKY